MPIRQPIVYQALHIRLQVCPLPKTDLLCDLAVGVLKACPTACKDPEDPNFVIVFPSPIRVLDR